MLTVLPTCAFAAEAAMMAPGEAEAEKAAATAAAAAAAAAAATAVAAAAAAAKAKARVEEAVEGDTNLNIIKNGAFPDMIFTA